MTSLHIVITGASRGIGFELARQSLAAGHSVSVFSRSEGDLPKLRKEFGDRLRWIACDVTSDAEVKRAVGELGAKPIDILINNSGTYLDGKSGFSDLPMKDVTESFAVNTISPIRVTQACLPLLEKAKHPKLALTSSLMGSIDDNTSGGSYAYRMSKTALNMFAKCFSIDFPKIVTLTLHPGWVRTAMGGSEAPTLPEASAKGLLKVIHEASKSESGRFYDFEGDELAW